MDVQVLRQGVDTLDVAFQGALPAATRRLLARAKDAAALAGEPEYVDLNGVTGYVKETGAKGGFAFILDTGMDGEIWTFKNSDDPEQWNIFVTVKNAQLAVAGYDRTVKNLGSILEILEAKIIKESVNRIDWAVDFISKKFVLKPDDFVNHSHATRAEHAEIPEGGSEFGVRYSGRIATSVTVGKMPGRQVIVYDKRREVARKVGSHWFEIWGIKKEDCPPIWRIELRAGKKHLKDFNITTFDDLKNRMGDMFKDAAKNIRLLDGAEYSNVTYAKNHAIWTALEKVIAEDLGKFQEGATRGQIREVRRIELSKLLKNQLFGLATTIAVANKIDPAIAAKAGSWLVKDWRHYVKGSKFYRNYQKTAKKYTFLDEKVENWEPRQDTKSNAGDAIAGNLRPC